MSRHLVTIFREIKTKLLIYATDPDEAPEGPNIFEETTSKFQNLLDNEELLDQFLDKEDFADIKKEVPSKNNNDQADLDRDPESSFLRISGHLRQALKKHLPYGMLEHLEEQIVTHFTQNPGQSFEVSDLSSYERLLAHTCSMYNSLISQSKILRGRSEFCLHFCLHFCFFSRF